MESHFPDLDSLQSHHARERVVNDLQTLVRDAEALLRATAGDLSVKASEARVKIKVALSQAKATCDELQQKGIESAKAAAKKADETVRAHPYEAIGIAFGVALIAAALFTRRR